jgi:hypothetical protein
MTKKARIKELEKQVEVLKLRMSDIEQAIKTKNVEKRKVERLPTRIASFGREVTS